MGSCGLLWFVLAGAAAQPNPSAWRLRSNLTALDGPGSGRYTQVRADYHGVATMVWNGDCEGKDGCVLRLARCVDAAVRCGSTTTAVTIMDGSGKPVTDPRFISMELIRSNPVLAYGALGNTESHLMFCHDPICAASTTYVLATASKVRHCDLFVVNYTPEVVVTVGLSNPQLAVGSTLLAVRATMVSGAIETTTVATSAAPFRIDDKTGLPTGGLEMPSLVDGPGADGVRYPDVAYWDVTARSLMLVRNATSAASGKRIVVAGPAYPGGGPASSPGAWPRLTRGYGGTGVVIAHFDLAEGALLTSFCADATPVGEAPACAPPRKADSVGHRDVSDFGAGAFPAWSIGDGQPAFVYFSQLPDAAGDEVGHLKLLQCSNAYCTAQPIATLATGKAGFGRDASLTFVPPAQGGKLELFVTCLDLNGKDEEGSMLARLGVYTQS